MEAHRAQESDDCLHRLRVAGEVDFGSIRRAMAIQSRLCPMSTAARAGRSRAQWSEAKGLGAAAAARC